MTLAQGVLCIREFLSNSKNTEKLLDGTGTHQRTSTGAVIMTHISL
jgi:hypothetical protein